ADGTRGGLQVQDGGPEAGHELHVRAVDHGTAEPDRHAGSLSRRRHYRRRGRRRGRPRLPAAAGPGHRGQKSFLVLLRWVIWPLLLAVNVYTFACALTRRVMSRQIVWW